MSGHVLRKSPVHHLHFAEGTDHDVGRLQVPVQHAAVVGGGHRLAHLLERRDQTAAAGWPLLDDGG
ncbi:MAG TPA: hypothetical protein VKD71_02175, partial [Gemmataceae bacterium]|nr:hypothetical protein [Gemmataceae bacterium]